MKKRVILSTYDDIKNPHYGGGGAIAIHELAKRISEEYCVEVLSWNHSGVKRETIDGVTYKRFGWPFVSPKLGMLFYQTTLPLNVTFGKYDLWVESFCPPFTTSFLPLFSRKPVLGVVHMISSEDMRRKYKINLRFIEKLGIKQYRQIVVTSKSLEDKVKAINPNCAYFVIPNGVESVWRGKIQKRNQILYLGRLEINQKGIDLLIDGYTRYTRNGGNFKLVIAGNGSGDEMSQIEKMVVKNSLKDMVQIVGKVEGGVKTKLLKESAFVIVPSRFETYSMVALEAMAYGLPVLNFDIEGMSWIPKGANLRIHPFDTETLSGAIKKLSEDENKRKKMGEEGRAYAKDYTWESVALLYTQAFKQIL